MAADGGGVGGEAHAFGQVHDDLVAGEEAVDLLEREVLGLRVEEVDDGNEEGVEDGEVDVRAPADAVDRDGHDFDDEEGKDPLYQTS